MHVAETEVVDDIFVRELIGIDAEFGEFHLELGDFGIQGEDAVSGLGFNLDQRAVNITDCP